MAQRIKLVRYAAQRINFWYFGAIRMRIECEAVDGTCVDPYIFIYSREPINPYTSNRLDLFHAVAGPCDMADIPAGEPDPKKMWPFYRLNFMEHDYRNPSEAAETWEIIKTEARVLCEACTRFSNLVVEESLWIPSAPPVEDSESVSESL